MSTQQVQLDVSSVRSALENNAEFFIEFFMGGLLTTPVPDIHKEIFPLMTRTTVEFLAIAISREHAKTTLAKLATIYYLLFTKYNFVVYLSNTADVAIPATNDIIAFLLCENFQAIFGAIQFSVKRDGEGNYTFVLPHSNKKCTIKALGAGKQVRGLNIGNWRPQVAIVDDLEDKKIITNERLYRELKAWFYSDFLKALDSTQRKVIQIGNIVQLPCLLDEHCRSEFWSSRRYGVLRSDGTPLWPQRFPMEKIAKDFHMYQQIGQIDVWFAEMMNLPIPSGGGIIDAAEINYRPQRLDVDIEYGFLTVDLAISSESWAHKTVVAVHGWIEEQQEWQIVEYRYWTGIDPVALFRELITIQNYWRIYLTGIEAVAYQASLQSIYQHLLYIHYPTEAEIRKFVPIHVGRLSKNQRIIPWAGMLKKVKDSDIASYAITEGDFLATQQLLTYDPQKRENDDDIIDACASGVIMIREYFMEIINQNRPEVHEPKSIYEIAEV